MLLKKIVRNFSIVLLGVIGLGLALIFVSPRPTALLINKMFEGGLAVKPANYDEIEKQTISYTDISYESKFKDGYLDVVKPIKHSGELPVIFWVHGGAFVGGDKSDVTEYAVQIANQGYVVVNLNYQLAPSAIYPTPVKQLDEAYQYIKEHAEDYGIDLERIYFAGDSAGAQIASQYLTIQVDKNYKNKSDIQASIPIETLKGALLFCGPYDISQFASMSDNAVLQFFLKRVGWSYIGERDWSNSEVIQEASIIEHVGEAFPSTFITDGNVNSFQNQGVALAEKLRAQGVRVQDIFYSLDEAKLEHEYQFIMNTPQAVNTYNQLIDFLNETSQ